MPAINHNHIIPDHKSYVIFYISIILNLFFFSSSLETYIQSPPIVIVVNNSYHSMISNDAVILLINNRLPEFSQLFQSSTIYRIDTDETLTVNSALSNDLLNPF